MNLRRIHRGFLFMSPNFGVKLSCHRSRSLGQITYTANMCRNCVRGGHIKFILGQLHEVELQLRGAQNECHGSGGYLAYKPGNLLYGHLYQ